MNKKLFVKSLNAIIAQIRKDRYNAIALSSIFPGATVTNYDNSTLIQSYINLLKELTGDCGEWIEWYIWECEFSPGKEKDYKSGFKDGKEYLINTPAKLYDMIKR